jgi:hypothetical protein
MSSVAAAAPAPSARRWRSQLRRARRAHHDRSLGDAFTDLYMLLWLVLVYGGALAASIHRHLQEPSRFMGASAERYWIGVAVLLAGTGLAWRGLRAVGPLLATPAEQAWGISTPVDRRGWLLPRFVWLVFAGAVVTAVLAMVVALLGLHIHALGWAAFGGAVWGVAGVAWTVPAQGGATRRRWPSVPGVILTGLGALVAAVVVFTHYTGRVLLHPVLPPAVPVVGVGLALAATALVLAVRTLPRLDLVDLGSGAQIAVAAATATIGLDLSLLSGVLDQRRWRSVGKVRSRPFLSIFPGRTSALLQAELRRQVRRPGALGAWVALVLVQYAIAVVVPSAAGVAHVIIAYLAANRLTGGLRTLGKSPGLRRAIGGDETQTRLVHLIVPAVGLAVWWAVTWPAGGSHVALFDLPVVLGVLAASYRAATRPPMTYGGAVMETPLGLFPVELVMQLARGPDLLAVAILIHAMGTR